MHSNTETLHENEVGKVLVCTCCKEMQLHFGNVMIQMPAEGVKNLHTVLEEMSERYDEGAPDGKFLIRTPQQNMFITVTQDELNTLIELLGTSLYMLEVKRVLIIV